MPHAANASDSTSNFAAFSNVKRNPGPAFMVPLVRTNLPQDYTPLTCIAFPKPNLLPQNVARIFLSKPQTDADLAKATKEVLEHIGTVPGSQIKMQRLGHC